MKPPSEDHDLIRWLDGEMTATERASFEERLKRDPAMAQEAKELQALSAGIRAHLPANLPVPHADFFNSQIQVRIAQMEADEARAKHGAAPGWGGWLQWLRQPWMAAACAAAVVVVSVVLSRLGMQESRESSILSSYTPNSHVQARAFHDEAAEATVLMLDGLEAVPAERKISGVHAVRSEWESEVASTTLYDSAGASLLMISSDALGHPMIWPKAPRG